MAEPRQAFSKVKINGKPLADCLEEGLCGESLDRLIMALDFLHIQQGLLAAYDSSYPLVEPRELIPSFDAPLIEYTHLPAFSMVVLDRPLSYQDEVFQFDLLEPEGQPADPGKAARNRALLRQRLPRNLVPELDRLLGRGALTPLNRYELLLPLLAHMDRGHVLARGTDQSFYLAGVYASFPSNLDGEIKRFGRAIGKFQPGLNDMYAANRHFVYRFFMEQMGFPICGERHTSAALFARHLQRSGEDFVVKVLGTSDRTLTTFTPGRSRQGLPQVVKTALMSVASADPQTIRRLSRGGYFVDPKRRVVILRVRYNQHRHHPENVLEDRGLSVQAQEVVHPQSGRSLPNVDVLGLSQDRLLLLNDIVRGEYSGSILYRGQERVEGTADATSRLKFLSAWLNKHRHILADYSPDNFTRATKVIYSFLEDEEGRGEFESYGLLYQEVRQITAEVRVAHRLRLLEKLVRNRADASGRRLTYLQVLIILVHVLREEGADLARDNPRALRKLLQICGHPLSSPYLKRRYFSRPAQSPEEQRLVEQYCRLQELVEGLQGRPPAPAQPQAGRKG